MVKNLQVNFDKNFVFNKEKIHNLVRFLRKKLDFEIFSLVINFVPSAYLLEINRKYLNHNYLTDIITFNYSGSHNNLDGEIFISFEDAEINADKFGVSAKDEYFRLIIHGVLHLLNYDDHQKNDKIVMKRLENILLKSFSNKLVSEKKS